MKNFLKKYLFLILASAVAIPLLAFASTLTGAFNSFSATGLTNAHDAFVSYVFDSSGNSLGDSTCDNTGDDFFTNQTIAQLGGVEPSANGTYLLVVGTTVCAAQLAAANGFCGAGQTTSTCAAWFDCAGGGANKTYCASMSFAYPAPSSTVVSRHRVMAIFQD